MYLFNRRLSRRVERQIRIAAIREARQARPLPLAAMPAKRSLNMAAHKLPRR